MGFLVGIAQAFALIPGVSRSGSTLTAGIFLKMERATAARFSFLLGLPAVFLAGLVEIHTSEQLSEWGRLDAPGDRVNFGEHFGVLGYLWTPSLPRTSKHLDFRLVSAVDGLIFDCRCLNSPITREWLITT